MTTAGTGRVAVVPDLVVARLAAQTTDVSAAAAHESAAQAAAAMLAALRAAGVADRDLRTASTSSWTDPGQTEVEDGRSTTRLPRTTVTLTVEARLRDVTGSGDLIGAALVAAGEAGRLDGTSLQVSDPGAARAEARALAFAEAAAAAAQLAGLAGRTLGPVVDVREGGLAHGGGLERMMRMAASAVPVEAGEQEVVVELVVRHAWADGDEGPADEAPDPADRAAGGYGAP